MTTQNSLNAIEKIAAPYELKKPASSSTVSAYPSTPILDPAALQAAVKAHSILCANKTQFSEEEPHVKNARRKPGARECMQIVRRFGANIIPECQMTTLLDYCWRGKVEHMIRMRERLDCHSRFLESQLAGLEALAQRYGESSPSDYVITINPVANTEAAVPTTTPSTVTTSTISNVIAQTRDDSSAN